MTPAAVVLLDSNLFIFGVFSTLSNRVIRLAKKKRKKALLFSTNDET